jgi:hypothetical protein
MGNNIRVLSAVVTLAAFALVAGGLSANADDQKARKLIKARIQAAQKAAIQNQKKQATPKPAQPKTEAKAPAGSPNRPATPAPVTVAKKAPPLRIPTKIDQPALTTLIDTAVNRPLEENGIRPSPLAEDAEFLRRVYLDLTGVIPPVEKTIAFLDSSDIDKRRKLIDDLLESPEYGKHQTDIWQTLLVPKTSDNRRLQSDAFVTWLEDGFGSNKPWNRLVSELLTAAGPQDENAATTFFIANNTPDKLTDQVSRLFLGVQLQCAQCHDHPFTEWKQDEYWAMAAFFMKVRTNGNPQQAARQGRTLEVVEVNNPRQGRRQPLPDSAKTVPAKFFQGDQPRINPTEPNRPVLAKWLTAPENPFFARAMVNRTWTQLFGRGLVTPVDDMHDGNPATHPELLDALAGQFAANGFDLKFLIRSICNSQAYQRTSKPYSGNDADEIWFSHMPIKSLTPEQMFDSLTAIIGRNPGRDARPPRNQGQPLPMGAGPRGQFVNFFNVEEGANPVEYQSGVPQVLRLMNSPQFNPSNSAVVMQLLRARATKTEIAEKLCLTALSRRPTPEESVKWTAFLSKESDMRRAAGDLLWAMLNSSEFALNR